jgi:basic membrane protein A and related proteins
VSTAGGPGRRRPGPLLVAGGAVLLVALVVGVAVALARGGGEHPAPRPTSTIGRGVPVCAVVGSPDAAGTDLRIPLLRGLRKAHRELGVTGSLVSARGPDAFRAAVARFARQGCRLVAMAGAEADGAAPHAALAFPRTHFAVIGGSAGNGPPNLAAVRFHLDQAAFQAGYLAAALTTTGRVGEFGSVRDPSVEGLLDGFAAGVRKLNLDRFAGSHVVGWKFDPGTGVFTGSANDAGRGRAAAESLISRGADVLFAIGGGSARAAARVASSVGYTWMIGSGTDRGAGASDPDLWLTSVEERAGVMLRLMIDREVHHRFQAGVVEATYANGGVGLAPFRGLAATIPGNLRYDLEAVAAGLANGSLSTDPATYPKPTPSPGSTSSAPGG